MPGQPQQHRRHAERQRDLARRRRLQPYEIHVRGRQAHRLPPEAPIQQHRPPGIVRARKARLHLRLQPVELLGRHRRARLARIEHQRARWPRRIVEQRLVPARRRIVDRHSARSRAQAASAIMIVERMKALDVHHRRASRRVLRRQPRQRLAHAIEERRRPSSRVRLNRHPLGPQREQLRRFALAVGQHLDEGVAVQQQVRRDRLEQPLPARSRRHQRGRRLVRSRDRRSADALRHQPHRPLRHRVAEVSVANLRLIIARPLAGHEPVPEPTRQRRPRPLSRGLPAEPFHKSSWKLLSPRGSARGRSEQVVPRTTLKHAGGMFHRSPRALIRRLGGLPPSRSW